MAFHEVVFLTEGAKEQERKGKVRNYNGIDNKNPIYWISKNSSSKEKPM